MAAITWHNVSGPTGAAELNALAGASRQIGGAFDSLQNALVNFQKEEGRQFDQRKTDNTNAFLNALHSQYRTPEELDAAIKSGAVNQLQQQFGSEVHADQIRGAADNLLASRRQQGLAGMQYNNQISADQAAPIKSRAQYLASIGDQAGAQAELQKLDPRYQGEAASAVLATNKDHFGLTRLQNQEARDQESHGWAGEQHKSRLATDAASRAASAASTAASNLRTQLARFELQDVQDSRNVSALADSAAAAYKANVMEQKSKFDELAKNNPSLFPTDARGKFEPTKVGPDNRAAIEQLAKQNGISLDVYNYGDTDAHENFVQSLQQKGVTGKALDAAIKAGNKFSTAPAALLGNDAASSERAEKLTAAVDKAITESAGGTPTTLQNMNSFLASDLKKNLVDSDNAGQILRVTSKWVNGMKGGIDVGNGSKVFPNTDMITNALNATIDSEWGYLSDSDIESALKKIEDDFRGSITKAKKVQDKVK